MSGDGDKDDRLIVGIVLGAVIATLLLGFVLAVLALFHEFGPEVPGLRPRDH